MPPKEINIPPELIQAIKNDKLIIFVGAGLSYELINTRGEQLKGWENLVLKILENLEKQGFDVAHLKGLIGKCEPVEVLNLIERDKNLNKSDIAHFIKDFVDLAEENDFSLHQKLFELSNKIITTNYDTAFELKIKALRKNTAHSRKPYELTAHKDANKPLLFKLHGCYEDIGSLVLFPSQYNDLYRTSNQNAQHSLTVLKSIILNKTVLFIGCGMGDFQINNLFAEVKKLQGPYNQKHFIISKYPLDSSLDFLFQIPIQAYKEIPYFIEKLLAEKEKFKQEKTHEVKVLEKQLAESEKQIVEYEEQLKHITNDTERKDKLLEREASKYFRKGLEFSLNEKWEKAIKKYKTAIELKPDLVWALTNLGSALGELAKTKEGADSSLLYDRAIEKYQRVIDINPDFPEVFYCWGFLIRELASTKSGEEADSLYYEAIQKYKKAIKIDASYYEAFNNWGALLNSLALTKSDSEAEVLYNEAIEKFQKAIKIKPNFTEAIKNWGTVLGNLAKIKLSKTAENLYYQAFEKFQRAIEIKPNYHEAFYNWGTNLLYLAKTKSDKETKILLQEALEKIQRSIEIKSDKYQAIYNLACTYALLSDKKNALLYLRQSLEYQEIKTDYVLQDEDWKAYLEDKDFQKLIKKYSDK